MFSTDINGFAPGSRRRGWATMLSFLLQCVAVALLVLTPVLFPHVLPRLNAAPPLINFVTLPSEPPAEQVSSGTASGTSQQFGGRIMIPTSYPTHPQIIDDGGQAPAPIGICSSCLSGSMGPGVSSLIAIAGPVVPPPPPAVNHPRVSAMMEGMLIRKVQPIYPPAAKSMRIQGPVVLQAIISKEGKIEHLQVISGHFLLVPAAIDAVRQWRYRPYILNGEPVEVETQVTVNFVLAGS